MLTLTKFKLYGNSKAYFSDLHDPSYHRTSQFARLKIRLIVYMAIMSSISFLIQVSMIHFQFKIHLDLALQQVFRVLKKGGIAAFSVWGPENSPKFTIPDLAKNSATQNPSFHLHDSETLRQRVLKAGNKQL